MIFLVFSDQANANTAVSTINSNMNMNIVGVNAATGEQAPDKTQTTSWAVPTQRLDGKWCFAMPPEQHMTNVVNYTQETFSKTWFPQEEL